MCRANWESKRVRHFLRPTKLRWSRKENLREGTSTLGVGLLTNMIDGAQTANSLASWTDKDCHAPCTITRARKIFSVILAKVEVNGKFESPKWQYSWNFSRQIDKWREMHYGCIFEVVIVWSAHLSHSGILVQVKNNILSLWNFPPLCCWRLLSVLLRTFFFEFFCFFEFFFFDRTLVSVDALGRLLGSKP